jgi:hypothetical protein
MQTMEECVRFYNHFGLTLAEAPRELPDHISTQLEFLHFLAFREAEAWRDGRDPGPWQRAGRDFLERHPGRWVPKLRERLASRSALPRRSWTGSNASWRTNAASAAPERRARYRAARRASRSHQRSRGARASWRSAAAATSGSRAVLVGTDCAIG